ncbi:MAG TPA: tRNA (N6-isopentenyl adenosine(37)-C2)-methylthiotransferase MiaB [Pirellulales bacterium]|nr:tRNA (N6-isopentenyl adenosine(37)-C2)-methylthiotransferase MiaB [Pirellulales bacterium]
MGRKLYIETVGCQMNMLDSELVVASLRNQGYELVSTPKEADTILFNTCSVRQHAEDKIYSALGRLKHAKTRHPDKIIGVLGCMAQKDQRLIFERAPYVDLIVGPGQLHQVPALLQEIAAGGGPRMEVSLGRKEGNRHEVEESFESYDPLRDEQMRPTPYQAFVRIMIGCDKFCTYCIVPSVRGPEQSRHPGQIEAEVRRLAAEGCREITLLGQTVNSYRYHADGRTTRLADLISRLHEIDGLDRIKFVTNFPKDMTDDLLQAVRDLPKCSHYLHVPAQSGSNEILRRMKRNYMVEEYREMLGRIRETIPDAAVTSDFIVGFCGETDADFEATAELVRESRFKNSFIFKYSPRPGTKSDELFADDVPEEVKRRRNNELLAIQNTISEEDNQAFLGREVTVLVEGPSKSSRKHASDGEALQLTGRTNCDRIVVFEGNRRLIGQFLPLVVYDANAFTLFGSVVTQHVGPEIFELRVANGRSGPGNPPIMAGALGGAASP